MARGLGELEQLLLFAVLRLGGDAYGLAVRREIARRTGKDVSAGALYTGLDRLRKRGFLTAREAASAPSRGGRRRKYYRLEPEGARALEATYSKVALMADGVLPELRALAAVAWREDRPADR